MGGVPVPGLCHTKTRCQLETELDLIMIAEARPPVPPRQAKSPEHTIQNASIHSIDICDNVRNIDMQPTSRQQIWPHIQHCERCRGPTSVNRWKTRSVRGSKEEASLSLSGIIAMEASNRLGEHVPILADEGQPRSHDKPFHQDLQQWLSFAHHNASTFSSRGQHSSR